MEKLVLFDIDGTLIKSSGSHSRFTKAFKQVYGVDTDLEIINYHGMTDQQIIIEVLKKNGLKEEAIRAKLNECMSVVMKVFEELSPGVNIIALDGVQETLGELSKKNVLIGLVTGNLEPIAKGKLRKVGLDKYFKVGGFGSDDMDRANLVKIAMKRAEEKFGFRAYHNVFLCGDAPQDMQAGKAANVKTIGVTTGIYAKEQLKNAGADYVLENLKDTDKFLGIII